MASCSSRAEAAAIAAPSPRAAAGVRRATVMLLVSDLGFGGAERQTVQLAHLLADRFEVVLGYLKADNLTVRAQSPTAARIRRDRLKAVVCLDVRRRIDGPAVRKLAQTIETHDVQAVLCANTFPLLYAQLARCRLRRPLRVVEVYHTTLIESRAARLKLLSFRPLFWLSSQLVFVSEAQRRHCLRRALWARRVSVIHNGVDVGHFSPAALPPSTPGRYGFGAEDRVVGLCAVFRPEKAHGDLLEAVAALKARGAGWKALLIGDGPTRPAVEATIARCGLEDDVRITGYLDDVRAAVMACDVIALVSTSIETLSIAALEAMALGKPMLMSAIGGAAELVEPGVNGYLFPAGDVNALAQCLQAMADRSLCTRMGRAARQRVERLFSEDAMRARYVELIEGLLGEASRRPAIP
jgi:glycosyltransferase involved in cell wall biosynthesis